MVYLSEKQRIKAWLDAEYDSLGLVHVSREKEFELKENFIKKCVGYDKRIANINRERIIVWDIQHGRVEVSLVAYGKYFSSTYPVKPEN